jgi:hypothetical protein
MKYPIIWSFKVFMAFWITISSWVGWTLMLIWHLDKRKADKFLESLYYIWDSKAGMRNIWSHYFRKSTRKVL